MSRLLTWQLQYTKSIPLKCAIKRTTLFIESSENLSVENLSIVFPGLKWPPLFANYSLMAILIEKLIREINLDVYRVIESIFST